MSSNKISKTEEPIKSLEIKTKEEEKKLFKDEVLDKFNFWIYVAFIILGLVLLISFILLIYSIFSSYSSSSSSSSAKPPEPIIINHQVPKVNINPVPVQIPPVKPVVNLPPPTPIPIIKKIEEPKPSFFSSWFSSSSKKTTPTTPTTPTTNINNKSSSLPTLETSSSSTPTTNNKTSSIFSSFGNIFPSFSNRNNIPKPTDNKITGGRYIKRYKNYRNNYK